MADGFLNKLYRQIKAHHRIFFLLQLSTTDNYLLSIIKLWSLIV